MQTLPAAEYGQADPFEGTEWSVILAAGKSQIDPDRARVALAQLCETYWPPLYGYVRGRGYSVHDAQDLTQGFFEHLIEHKIYTRTDREKGKFRSFLLASLKHFLSHAREREQALKRGGGHDFVPLDEARAQEAESLFRTHAGMSTIALPEDRIFERTWAETLVATVLDRLRDAYNAEGKQSVFEDFRGFITITESQPTYSEMAAKMAVPESTLRSHVTRLRRRYRDILRSEVRRTVDSEAEVDGELRELLRVLSAA